MGIFNDLKLKINLGFQFLPCLKLSNGSPKYDQTYISLLFYIFLSVFSFSSDVSNILYFYYSIDQYSSARAHLFKGLLSNT